MTTKTKAKPKGWLTSAKDALLGNPQLDWAALEASADQALDDAKEHHARCAYNAQVELPGSSEALIRANERLQAARTKLDQVKAARGEYERQQAQERRDAHASEIAKQDKASQARFDRLAAHAVKGEAAIAAYVVWYGEALTLASECQAEFGTNERLRNITFSVNDPVSREIVRLAVAKVGDGKPLPPGANVFAATTSDPREWTPLATYFADLAKAVLA